MNKKNNDNKKNNNKGTNNVNHFKLPLLIVGITLIVGIAIGVGIMFFTNNTNLSDTNYNASISSPYAGKTPYSSKLNSISVTCTKTSSNKAKISCSRYYTNVYKTSSLVKKGLFGSTTYYCPIGYDYINSSLTKKALKLYDHKVDCYGIAKNSVLFDGCSYGVEPSSNIASISGNTLTLNKNMNATVKVHATYTTKYGNTKTASCSVTLTPATSTNTTNNSRTSKKTKNTSNNKAKNATTKNYKFYYTDPSKAIQKGSSTNITSSTAIVCSANNSNVTITTISNGCKITGKKVGTSTIKIANKKHQATYYTETISIIKKNASNNTTVVNNHYVQTANSSSKKATTSKKSSTSKKVKPTSITIKDTDRMVEVGKSKKINYTIKPTNATNKNVSFKSNNTKIVTVDAKGNFTGKKVGKAKITVTSKEATNIKKVVNVEVIKKETESSKAKATTSNTSNITANSAITTTTDKSDAKISALTVKDAKTGASVNVKYNSDNNTYSATVANSISQVRVNVVTKNLKATITEPAGLKKDKVVTWNLEAGKTKTVKIIVKSENGKKKNQYTLKITREAKPKTKSSDATLKSVKIYKTEGYNTTTKTGTEVKASWDKTFNKNTTSYNIKLPSGVNSIKLVAYPSDNGAVISNPYAMRNNQAEYGFKAGETRTPIITVTAENGTTKTYTFKITSTSSTSATKYTSDTVREKSSDATLKSLKVDNKNVSLVKDKYDYDVSAEAGKKTLEVKLNNQYAMISTPSGLRDLNETYTIEANKTKTINIKVQAENGTTKTYNINIKGTKATTSSKPKATSSKASSSVGKGNATISALTVKDAKTGASANVKYNSTNNTYSATVANSISQVRVNVITKNSKATITEPAGLTKDKVVTWKLDVGKTKTVKIKVKSENGKNTNPYTLKITREAKPKTKSSDATLKSVKIYKTEGYNTTTKTGTEVKASWDKNFNKNTTSYNIILPSGTKDFEMVAYPSDNGAVISEPSGMVNNQAKHTITNSKTMTIKVKAENGATKTYTFNMSVQKSQVSVVNQTPGISQSTDYASDFSLSMKFTKNTQIQYTIGMKNDNLKSWLWSTNNKSNGTNYSLYNQGKRTSSTPTLDKTSYNRVGRITKYYTNGNIKEWVVMPDYNSKTNAIYNEFSIELVSITDTLATYKIKIADPSKISKWVWYTNNKNNGKEYTTYEQGTKSESTPLLQKASYERVGRIEIYYKTGETRRYSVKPNYNTKTNITEDGFAVINPTPTSSSEPVKQEPANDFTSEIEKEKNTIKKIVLNNDSGIYLNQGRSYEIKAIVLPGTAVSRDVNWISSNPSIATVSTNGMIYGESPGTVTITAVSKYDSSIKKSVNVVINKPISNTIKSDANIENNDAQQTPETSTPTNSSDDSNSNKSTNSYLKEIFDINNDGEVNSTDYSIISHYLLKSPSVLNSKDFSSWKTHFDVINPNGIDLVNVKDVFYYILGSYSKISTYNTSNNSSSLTESPSSSSSISSTSDSSIRS